MEKNLQNITTILQEIKGNGTFVVSEVEKFTIPGLHIEGFGEVGFPVTANQAQNIIGVSHKAPFGQGSKTIYDTSVRSVWEIDANLISFHNPDWQHFLNKIIKKVKNGLGFEKEKSVEANLYKLLVYEPGDFFLPHKDSEKEKGMFGTLIIGLPSNHKGGELEVNFDNRERSIDFSEACNSYKIPFVGFFADCIHEVKPVLSGYRICLTYNLIRTSKSSIQRPEFSNQQKEITALLTSCDTQFDKIPKAILLGHEYTPANFSIPNLKGHDKPRAEALLNGAEQAGYHAQLALVTHYQNGQLETDYNYYDSYRNNRYNEPDVDGTMGEVYEEETYIEHWIGQNPGLGNLYIEQKDIISELKLGEGEPTEQEEEGFTGNAGMTIDYWYHYGALILWPKSKHITILKNRPIENQLEWLGYYITKSQVPNSQYIHIIREIISGFSEPNFDYSRYNTLNFSILATALCYIQDDTIVSKLNTILSNIFDSIDIESWYSLIKNYNLSLFQKIFTAVGNSNNLYKIGHLVHLFTRIAQEKIELDPLLIEQIQHIPDYISTNDIHNVNDSYLYYRDNPIGRVEIAIRLIRDILILSTYKEEDKDWTHHTSREITKSLSRRYLNKILLSAIVESKNKTPLFYSIKEICEQELSHKTKETPQPPKDWTRKVPNSKHNFSVWEMLTPFLNSPTDSIYEYRANQQLRQEVENAIRNVTIDLKTKTIEKGRPYTLKITKTQKEYEKLLNYWKEDKMLLEQLEKTY